MTGFSMLSIIRNQKGIYSDWKKVEYWMLTKIFSPLLMLKLFYSFSNISFFTLFFLIHFNFRSSSIHLYPFWILLRPFVRLFIYSKEFRGFTYWRPTFLSYKNQSIHLLSKLIDWFLYVIFCDFSTALRCVSLSKKVSKEKLVPSW